MYRVLGHLGILVGVLSTALFAATFWHKDANLASMKQLRPTDPESSCGAVSVAIVSRILGRDVKIEDINSSICISTSGATSMLDLRRALSSLDFDVESLQCDPRQGIPRQCAPAILHLLYDHFVT